MTLEINLKHYLQNFDHNAVHNLCMTTSISKLDLQILSLGVKFIPRPFASYTFSLRSFTSSLNKLCCQITLQLYFKDPIIDSVIPPIHNNLWTPTLQPHLHNAINTLQILWHSRVQNNYNYLCTKTAFLNTISLHESLI